MEGNTVLFQIKWTGDWPSFSSTSLDYCPACRIIIFGTTSLIGLHSCHVLCDNYEGSHQNVYENSFEHLLSPDCVVLRLILRLPASVNNLGHTLQVNGLSPECVLMCVLRVTDNENDLEQSLQANDLSPELVLRWI